jgi:hypothetical protein
MRESRPYGSERGASSNGRPYRDRTAMLSAMAPGNRCYRALVDGEMTFAVNRVWSGLSSAPSGWRSSMGLPIAVDMSFRANALNSRGIVGAGNPGRFAPASWWS